jgi:phospholipid/cholesterol/gamma-HCH transport system permease protein
VALDTADPLGVKGLTRDSTTDATLAMTTLQETQGSPDTTCEFAGEDARFTLSGDWTLVASSRLEDQAALIAPRDGVRRAAISLERVAKLDTAGAWLVNRAVRALEDAGVTATLEHVSPEHAILLKESRPRDHAPTPRRAHFFIVDLLADLGASIWGGLSDLYSGASFLGEFVLAVGQMLLRPDLFRGASVVFHIEAFGFRSVPIIFLINLLVGAIVAQQGIFQLARFGATDLAVDLIGILVLRELGVLLTAIMIAGRSGSAITAEIGSMKMREEIDALRVMGLSPMDVLVAPRLFALVIALPLLAFIADMSALFGGLLVSWAYAGISPAAYVSLLQTAVGLNTFLVGLIKAPCMALVIGLIAANDGLATAGSAESLGRQVTASVVKAIFMVIVVDGLFAIFFAAMHY